MLSRRETIVALGSTVMLGSCATMRQRAQVPVGVEIYSESVQMSAHTLDGQTGFAIRLGRYPTLGIAWLWAHFFRPGSIWSYTDDALSTSRDRTDLETANALYLQNGDAELTIRRTGLRAAPETVELDGRFSAHRAARVEHGRGAVPIAIEARFSPATADLGVLAGRVESKGSIAARIAIGGGSEPLQAAGHYHEQVQTYPRFVDPFVYFRGTGENFGFTFIDGTPPSGYLNDDGRTHRMLDLKMAAPAARRRFVASLDGGRTASGQVEAVHTYWVKILDGWRHSQIVKGSLDGRSLVGGVNDWLEARNTYLGL